jgi:DNA-binding MarR family transcriptional regulator
MKKRTPKKTTPASAAAAPAQQTLGTLLRHLVELLDGDVEAVYRLKRLDYRPRFTPVVRMLAERGPVSIREIAAATSLSHSALSQTVSEMVRRGLVASSPGSDGRERIVHLTSKARRMLPKLKDCWAATNLAAAELSADLEVPLEELLRKAIAELEERPFFDRIVAGPSRP